MCFQKIKLQSNKRQESLLEQQWRGLRDNLMFYGIKESAVENEWSAEEDTEMLVKSFAEKVLEVDMSSISVARANKIGKKWIVNAGPLL